MKKVLAILVVLLMVPFVSMAATMSDADLAAVTGQSGVTIGISSSSIGLSFGDLSWGDYDGFGNTVGGYNNAGYVNILAYPVPMHITLTGLELTIDVGTNTTLGKTAVQIGIHQTTTGPMLQLDAFIADIVLDASNGCITDYGVQQAAGAGTTSTAVYSYQYSELAAVEAGIGPIATDKILGVVGISRLAVYAPAAGFNVTISAH